MDSDTYLLRLAAYIDAYLSTLSHVCRMMFSAPADKQQFIDSLCRVSWAVASQPGDNRRAWWFHTMHVSDGDRRLAGRRCWLVYAAKPPHDHIKVAECANVLPAAQLRQMSACRLDAYNGLTIRVCSDAVCFPRPPWASLDELYALQAWYAARQHCAGALRLDWLLLILPTDAEVAAGRIARRGSDA